MSLINDALKRASQAEKARAPRPLANTVLQPTQAPRSSGFGPGMFIAAALVLLVGGGGWFLWQYFSHRQPGAVAQNQANNQVAAVAPPVKPLPTLSRLTNPPAVDARLDSKLKPTGVPLSSHINTPPIHTLVQPTNKPVKPVATTTKVPTPPPVKTNLVRVTAPTNTSATTVTPIPLPPTNRVVKPVAPPATNALPVPVIPPATTLVAVVSPAPPTPPPPIPAPIKVDFPPLKLQGIFFRATNPSALINGKTVFAGDYIGDVKVVAIERQRVKVELEGATKTIPLD